MFEVLACVHSVEDVFSVFTFEILRLVIDCNTKQDGWQVDASFCPVSPLLSGSLVFQWFRVSRFSAETGLLLSVSSATRCEC